jgi:hypothetical protein
VALMSMLSENRPGVRRLRRNLFSAGFTHVPSQPDVELWRWEDGNRLVEVILRDVDGCVQVTAFRGLLRDFAGAERVLEEVFIFNAPLSTMPKFNTFFATLGIERWSTV